MEFEVFRQPNQNVLFHTAIVKCIPKEAELIELAKACHVCKIDGVEKSVDQILEYVRLHINDPEPPIAEDAWPKLDLPEVAMTMPAISISIPVKSQVVSATKPKTTTVPVKPKTVAAPAKPVISTPHVKSLFTPQVKPAPVVSASGSYVVTYTRYIENGKFDKTYEQTKTFPTFELAKAFVYKKVNQKSRFWAGATITLDGKTVYSVDKDYVADDHSEMV